MVASDQAGWQVVKSPTDHLNRIREKDTLQLEGDSSPTPVPQDQILRGLMREVNRLHLVDPSYWSFDERGVAAAIRKAGSSTTKGTNGLTVLHHRNLVEHGLAFLTELFNLIVDGVDILAIWKNSVINLILLAGKPREQGRSYSPRLLLQPNLPIFSWQ